MSHLTPDELTDAVEGTLDPARQAHFERCTACGEEVGRLSAILQEARAVDIPEPSPLFWDHFLSRVRAAIEADQVPRRGWLPEWLRWPVLVPLAGLALVMLALTQAVSRRSAPLPAQADARAEVVTDDLTMIGGREWAVVSDMVGSVGIEDAREIGIAVNPGDAELIALQLSAAEQRELVRLLKEEIDKPGG